MPDHQKPEVTGKQKPDDSRLLTISEAFVKSYLISPNPSIPIWDN
jgi:hypothetical protein